MALSKKLKITLISVFTAILLAVVLTGIALYWGWNVMQSIAKEIYGGPLPADVMAPVGINIDSCKMAAYVDQKNQFAVVIIQSPLANQENKTKSLSEKDVNQALSRFKCKKEMETLFKGAYLGTSSVIKLDRHMINTVKYANDSQQSNELGILNLDNMEMLFIATGNANKITSERVADFLLQMPVIKSDSHFGSK